jgi:hypothetical protein
MEYTVNTVLFFQTLKKGGAIHVTHRLGPKGCETSKLLHFLDQRWLTGGPRFDLLWPPPSLRFIFKNLNFSTVMA